jgi:glycosyltransferase involved in cell wall biosynthesis
MNKFYAYLESIKNSKINGPGILYSKSFNSNTPPLISIFTVSFNSIATIEKTILSVLSQNFKNYEYIIVDGGSTDGTAEVIKKYEDYLSYWVSESDEGPADATNKAIALSSGKYVFWLGSDDWVEPNYIGSAINVLEENPRADFVYGNLNYYDQEGEFCFTQKGDLNYTHKILYEMPNINAPSIVIKKNAFNRIGPININLCVASDYEWFLRLHISGGYGVFSNQLYANHRLGGISSNYYFRGLKEIKFSAIKNGSSRVISNYYYYKHLIKRIIKISLKILVSDNLYVLIVSAIRKN